MPGLLTVTVIIKTIMVIFIFLKPRENHLTFLLLKNLNRDEGIINLKQNTTSIFMFSERWCNKKDHRFTVAILQNPQGRRQGFPTK